MIDLLLGLALSTAVAAQDRPAAEVDAMLAGGFASLSVSGAGYTHGDLIRVTRAVLTKRRDCLSFSDSDYAPAASAKAREPVFRVTCKVGSGPRDFANFFLARSRADRPDGAILRVPPASVTSPTRQ